MPERIEQLKALGMINPGELKWNLTSPELVEEAVRRGEGLLAENGPLVVQTGQYTGRSPRDKFIVEEPGSKDDVWWGTVNVPFPEQRYERLRGRVLAYLQRRCLYISDLYVGADPNYRFKLRLLSDSAWSSLFARNMFIRPASDKELANYEPDYHILHAPGFKATPALDGTRSEAAVILNFARREVLIAGTEYGGEIKKSIFTVMNYLMPPRGVLSMHCSANYGTDRNDVSLFFGLSGTGKTTLSIDSTRRLIGDDEHGWSDSGVFNFEGGCYAKTIRLSPEHEPEIYATTRMFGTILENVVIDPITRRVDLDSNARTENTRASFPIESLSIADSGGTGGHPQTIFFLTCDAFGVLPPIAILTPEQAIYYFLLGYTAKVAGTERGVTEPQATFSACFGAPFMVHRPSLYAKLLAEKVRKHNARVYLVNTGWTGGPFGVGSRIRLPYTRAIIHAAQRGELADAPTEELPALGLRIPTAVQGVPDDVLRPRRTWKDAAAYDQKLREVIERFHKAFEAYRPNVGEEVRAVEPRV
ncbi:MAG: phosphoenolpyruvate carboxykinase (ATP) [Candidatus Sumerlaeia bacterium]